MFTVEKVTWSWQSNMPGISHWSEKSTEADPGADRCVPTATTRPSLTCTSSGPMKLPLSSSTLASRSTYSALVITICFRGLLFELDE